MTDRTVPVWVDNDGQKVQVGWATPDDGTGVRKINLLDGFDNAAIKNAKFGDIDSFETTLDPDETQEPPRTFQEPEVEVTPEAPAPVENAPEEAPLPSEPIEDAPDEELEAQPIDAGVAPEDTEPVVEATIEPDDSDETEDLPEGFEPAPAVQEEPTQDEDPAQP